MSEGENFPFFLTMHCVASQEMAFLAMSWCLKVCWNFLRKLSQVLRDMAVPVMAFSWKVLVQVRVDPSVIYERVKVIFFMSVLYEVSLTTR